MTTHNFSRQIPKNLVLNILSFTVTVVAGIWLTPYLLTHLGIVAYGLIPLAMFLSQYVSVITNSINMSINRFLLIALQNNKDNEANTIFNTALVVIVIFIMLQACIMGIVLFDIAQFFTIPRNLLYDATWLFGLTFIGFSISLFRSIFSTSMFTYNRLDILRTIDIVQNVVRITSILFFFMWNEPSLKYVGIANLLASLIAFIPTLYYFRRYTPQLKVNISYFSKDKVSELSKMSIWVLINQVGVLLLGNIDLYLVNKWIGVRATGEYAIVLQFTSIFRTFLALLAGILTPVIMIYYANNQHEKLKQFLFIAIKIMVMILILPLGIIIGMSENIISLWLGEQYTHLHSLVSFSMLLFIVAIPMSVLYNITLSYNKVKIPALVTLLFGFISIVGIYLLLTNSHIGLWGVLSMKLLIEIAFAFFLIIYVSNILESSPFTFLFIILFTVISFIVIILIIYIIKSYILLDTWLSVGLVGMGLSVIVYTSTYVILFSKDERSLIYKKFILERNKNG